MSALGELVRQQEAQILEVRLMVLRLSHDVQRNGFSDPEKLIATLKDIERELVF